MSLRPAGGDDPIRGTGGPRGLVLASRSPRRADLLSMLGIPFTVDPADIREEVLPGERADAHTRRLAEEKARVVAARRPGRLVVAGDTVVVRDGVILGKPRDDDHAVAMLLGLAGRWHEVASALALAGPGGTLHAGVSRTRVRLRSFGVEEARAYVATSEPMDKAGGYAIQGVGAVFVEALEGDYFTVVGLPLPLLVRLLAEAGVPYSFGGRPVGAEAKGESAGGAGGAT